MNALTWDRTSSVFFEMIEQKCSIIGRLSLSLSGIGSLIMLEVECLFDLYSQAVSTSDNFTSSQGVFSNRPFMAEKAWITRLIMEDDTCSRFATFHVSFPWVTRRV